MHRDLLGQVRLAMQALPDPSIAVQLCEKLLESLPGNAAVLLSPAMGKPFAEAVRGGEPEVVVWLLPDPTDVDSKQTTFVKADKEDVEETFSAMYKLTFPEASEGKVAWVSRIWPSQYWQILAKVAGLWFHVHMYNMHMHIYIYLCIYIYIYIYTFIICLSVYYIYIQHILLHSIPT